MVGVVEVEEVVALRVQVPNNHIFTRKMYYNYYYSNPKYRIIGYMDPLGRSWSRGVGVVGGVVVFRL